MSSDHAPLTRFVEVPPATLAVDVHGPLPTADGRPPLLLIGQPMTADGFASLVRELAGRTVVTYDPRGLGRSTRSDDSLLNDPVDAAADLHGVVAALAAGPVDVLASSGGAVNALAWVAAHPDDVRVLVAHEPPLLSLLPDAARAFALEKGAQAVYRARGWGHGLAAFIGWTGHPGPFPEDLSVEPYPDPAAFGLPTEDDGTRDDPLLSGVSDPVTTYRPDVAALDAAPTVVVLGVGEETGIAVLGRTTYAAAELLSVPVREFPGGHGGFAGPEQGQPADQPARFAARLVEVLEEVAP